MAPGPVRSSGLKLALRAFRGRRRRASVRDHALAAGGLAAGGGGECRLGVEHLGGHLRRAGGDAGLRLWERQCNACRSHFWMRGWMARILQLL